MPQLSVMDFNKIWARLPYECRLGWRYTRAGRASRRNGFISFISGVSMLGISLGVAALIIVLSVMNGFQKEVRDRMLGVVSHMEVMRLDGAALSHPESVMREIQKNPQVLGVAPFIDGQVLLARGDEMRGVLVRGIDPVQETQVSDLPDGFRTLAQTGRKAAQQLTEGSFGIVLGVDLAQRLGVSAGDDVTVIAPSGDITPVGVTPRLKKMQVLGTFYSGHYEYDANLALLHIQDAAKIFRLDGVAGLRVRVQDLHRAPLIANRLAQQLNDAGARSEDGALYVRDWTQQNPSWFAAVRVEKTMMFIILSLIVAVAAFNLVSTLVMTVTDKRADIAILRTLGASPRSIMGIFVVQGAAVGVVGTLVGVVLGTLVAFNIDVIVPALEALFGVSFLPRDVYLISRMPSDPQSGDIVPITLIALLLSFLATLYPSWSASRVHPAQALRYE